MACALPHHPLFHFLLLFLLPFSIVARTNGTVAVGTSITANNKDTPWLSPSGVFAFGFKPLQEKNLFLLSIWYYKIPDQTIFWYGHDGVPVSIGSKLGLTVDRGLVLSDPQGKELWNSQLILNNNVAHGFMNDTGNFVPVRNDSVNLWESFKNPTDTMLPTQIMESNGDGNLVLNTRDIPSNFAYDAYYNGSTSDYFNSSNFGYRVIFDDKGVMYILRKNNKIFYIKPQGMLFPTIEYFHRATLDFDGVFTQYYHPKTFNSSTKWTHIWSQLDNICVDIGGGEGSEACGFNSICRLNDNQRPDCKCPPGYSLFDSNNTYGSCKPNFTQSCLEDDINFAEDIYDFETLINTDWPTFDYEHFSPAIEAQCKMSCINDCFCAVAILGEGSYWKKKLPLSNGREDNVVNRHAFLKFRKRDPRTLPSPLVPETKKNPGTLILVGSVLLGSSMFINFVLIGAICQGFFLIHHKKSIKSCHGNHSAVETNLRCFAYEQLEGRLNTLVENNMEALNDWKRLERFLMVAIWCIQEDPSLRPTMRKVT
ncbi:G-type lectin S-receptor-like serine/threonine-protein kinase LECRK3 [Camellia lanceoleosa]|uniref:G-type lectin S-receptor-like serine/threonine-protein kinase LECRK3 n=1 Tax=Camellia lanceoleosa TaxID=1840588 RepID=A0ACC0F6J1_9ERIC|nr:G-type lectin S-receptor-like serine/threonine-protein kinase LECRK3 [Camellia lanceoleosa]